MNENQKKTSKNILSKKDLLLGILAGFFIGLFLLPILKVSNEEIYLKLKLAILPFFLFGTPLGLIVAHKISQKIPLIWQIAKFGVTGVINVLVDFGVLLFLSSFFKNYYDVYSNQNFLSFKSFIVLTITFYSLYKALSFIVANINSYFWNKFWTFDGRNNKKSEFFQFFIVSVVGFFVNVGVASLVFNSFSSLSSLKQDQWALIGAVFGSIAGLVWNFMGYKFFVFKK